MEQRAWRLIDKPAKWYRGDHYDRNSTHQKHCTMTAILAVYGSDSGRVFDRLRAHLGIQRLAVWNDSKTWKAVFETLKELDI